MRSHAEEFNEPERAPLAVPTIHDDLAGNPESIPGSLSEAGGPTRQTGHAVVDGVEISDTNEPATVTDAGRSGTELERILSDRLDLTNLASATDQMSDEEVERELTSLIELDIRLARTGFAVAYRLGKLFHESKRRVSHGGFGPWLSANASTHGLSRSTIGNYMRIAQADLNTLIATMNSQFAGNITIGNALRCLQTLAGDADKPRVREGRGLALPRASSDLPRRADAIKPPVATESDETTSLQAEDAAVEGLIPSTAIGSTSGSVQTELPSDADELVDFRILPPTDRRQPDIAVSATVRQQSNVDSDRARQGNFADELATPAPTYLPACSFSPDADPSALGPDRGMDIAARGAATSSNCMLTPTAADVLEASISDEEWLAGLPVRQSLTQIDAFDRDARSFRRLQSALMDPIGRAGLSYDEIEPLGSFEWQPKHWRRHVAMLARVRPPDHWRKCTGCRGTGAFDGGEQCIACEGNGFVITLHGDDLELTTSPEETT